MQLSDVALRVLGSLIEKAMATPQSYPLSVNALRSACNQTTNRDPVTAYGEDEIGEGLQELSAGGLVRAAYARRSSTPKYEHLLGEHLEIGGDEVAVLAVLMLRGPQTIGEIRQRTDRLHHFAELSDVAATLDRLAGHPFGALVSEFERQPGQKETRWGHLLGAGLPATGGATGGATANSPVATGTPGPVGGSAHDHVKALRAEVEGLRAEVAALDAEVAALGARVAGTDSS